MTDNMFDNFVRDKLSNHESPVPQGLWEKIERKKDKEPRGGFWIQPATRWGGFLLVLLIGAGYFLLQDRTPVNPMNTTPLSENAAAKNNGSATGNSNSNTTTPAGEGNTASNNPDNRSTITATVNNDHQNQTEQNKSTANMNRDNKQFPSTVSLQANKNKSLTHLSTRTVQQRGIIQANDAKAA
jgi:hypothetical protein